MITVAPSTSFETVQALGSTGLTGTCGVRVIDNAGATTVARVTAGVTEYPASSGIYAKTLTSPATAGQYTVVWDDGATTPGHVFTQELVVSAAAAAVSAQGQNYISRAQLKATLALSTDTYADADIDASITGACRAIDLVCDRRFWLDADAAQIRYYTPDSPRSIWIHDLATFTSLDVDISGDGSFSQSWTQNTNFVLEPLYAPNDGAPWTRITVHPRQPLILPTWWPRTVKLTGQFGWLAVPGAIAEATTTIPVPRALTS